MNASADQVESHADLSQADLTFVFECGEAVVVVRDSFEANDTNGVAIRLIEDLLLDSFRPY